MNGLRLAVSVGATLRAEGLRARTVTVKVRDADFTTRQASHTVPEAIESDGAIHTVASGLLTELRRRRRRPVRLLGVGLSGFVDRDAPDQLELFGERVPFETPRDRTLARVVDDLRERFGDDAVLPGRILEE